MFIAFFPLYFLVPTASKSYFLQLTIVEMDNKPVVCLSQYEDPKSSQFIQISTWFSERVSYINID